MIERILPPHDAFILCTLCKEHVNNITASVSAEIQLMWLGSLLKLHAEKCILASMAIKTGKHEFLGLPPAFSLVTCSAYSTLKMEAMFSETSVNFQRTTR
jgi:hypothetical protein